MHALNLHLTDALSYCTRNNNKPTAIYIGPNIYHEIPESWHMLVDFDGDRYALMQNKNPIEVRKYKQEIVSIMILATNSNVNLKHSGFASTDLQKLIRQQMQMRTVQNDKTQLIVIVDATINSMNDTELALALSSFDNEIKDFPALKAAHSLFGFTDHDSTPQIVAHMLKHGSYYINEYYLGLHGLSEYIYDTAISKDCFATNNYICIDSPYSTDAYNKPWTFLVIRFANERLVDCLQNILTDFLHSINIKFRDGFAFNETTYIILETAKPPILRISIGPEANKAQFASLSKYIEALNLCIKQFYADPQLSERLEKVKTNMTRPQKTLGLKI